MWNRSLVGRVSNSVNLDNHKNVSERKCNKTVYRVLVTCLALGTCTKSWRKMRIAENTEQRNKIQARKRHRQSMRAQAYVFVSVGRFENCRLDIAQSHCQTINLTDYTRPHLFPELERGWPLLVCYVRLSAVTRGDQCKLRADQQHTDNFQLPEIKFLLKIPRNRFLRIFLKLWLGGWSDVMILYYGFKLNFCLAATLWLHLSGDLQFFAIARSAAFGAAYTRFSVFLLYSNSD